MQLHKILSQGQRKLNDTLKLWDTIHVYMEALIYLFIESCEKDYVTYISIIF